MKPRSDDNGVRNSWLALVMEVDAHALEPARLADLVQGDDDDGPAVEADDRRGTDLEKTLDGNTLQPTGTGRDAIAAGDHDRVEHIGRAEMIGQRHADPECRKKRPRWWIDLDDAVVDTDRENNIGNGGDDLAEDHEIGTDALIAHAQRAGERPRRLRRKGDHQRALAARSTSADRPIEPGAVSRIAASMMCKIASRA